MNTNLVSGKNSVVKIANGKSVHYVNFDNAATTPPLNAVLMEIMDFAPTYSSVHRGTGYKSVVSSQLYEEGRDKVLDFVKADKEKYTAIFLKNTTECINKLSYRLYDYLKDKIVLTTYMEHHSNMLPWTSKYRSEYVEIDEKGRLDLYDLEMKLKKHRGKVGLVCVTGASNVTGYTNPIYKVAKMVHKYGAKIFVDGAQLIPHMEFDMKPIESDEHIDFTAFSAHKMYAPFGTGALIAPKEIFYGGYSETIGGGTIKFVSIDDIIWADVPDKEEAGTPNLMGVVALTKSIEVLSEIGMKNIEEYEKSLTSYALGKMANIPNLILYDDFDVENKVSIISFNMEGLHHTELADILGEQGGIAVRNGCFCAQPYVQKLLRIPRKEVKSYRDKDKNQQPGMVRVSLGFYNDTNEIDLLIYLLKKINDNIDFYQEKYRKGSLE